MLQAWGFFIVYCMAGCIRFAIKSETVHCHKKKLSAQNAAIAANKSKKEAFETS